MKYLFACLLFVNAAFARAQSDSLVNELEKAVLLSIAEPPEMTQDSCYNLSALVKVEISKRYQITAIRFSDVSPAWLKAEEPKLMHRLLLEWKQKISALAREEHIRKASVLLPLVIYSERFPCDRMKPKGLLQKKEYYLFDGQPLRGRLYFGRAIGESFYPQLSTYNH